MARGSITPFFQRPKINPGNQDVVCDRLWSQKLCPFSYIIGLISSLDIVSEVRRLSALPTSSTIWRMMAASTWKLLWILF